MTSANTQKSLTAPAYDEELFHQLVAHYRSTPRSAAALRWTMLEAAHVVGQTRFAPHIQTHWLMLGLSLETRDFGESLGQIMRMLLVPLGHALGRLPIGNPGRANVSAFEPMALRTDLALLLDTVRSGKHPADTTTSVSAAN